MTIALGQGVVFGSGGVEGEPLESEDPQFKLDGEGNQILDGEGNPIPVAQ